MLQIQLGTITCHVHLLTTVVLTLLFFSLVTQACQLRLSKKLSLLSQLALPYNKMSSRSPSPKSCKAQNKCPLERQDSSCLDDTEQSISLGFEPSPSLTSDPPSPCVPLDIEQGTSSVGRRPVRGSPRPSRCTRSPVCLRQFLPLLHSLQSLLLPVLALRIFSLFPC